MAFKDTLIRLMHDRNMKAAELSRRSGVTEASLSEYINGKKEPMGKASIAIAKALGVTLDELWDFNLETEGLPGNTQPAIEVALSKIPLLNLPVSAGDGQWLAEGYEYELTSFANIPEDADFALRVRGDSMAPMFEDNDIVFIKAGVIIESGQIGIFHLNGNGYLKMLQGNKLISINKAYAPIIVEEWDTFFCAGRIVGKIKQ